MAGSLPDSKSFKSYKKKKMEKFGRTDHTIHDEESNLCSSFRVKQFRADFLSYVSANDAELCAANHNNVNLLILLPTLDARLSRCRVLPPWTTTAPLRTPSTPPFTVHHDLVNGTTARHTAREATSQQRLPPATTSTSSSTTSNSSTRPPLSISSTSRTTSHRHRKWSIPLPSST